MKKFNISEDDFVIPSAANPATNKTVNQYNEIDASNIKASPFNEGLDMTKVNEIAESMRTTGLLEPIVVYDMPDGSYQIISGHQRYDAWCRVLGHKTIRAVIKEYEPDLLKRFKAHTEANTLSRNRDLKFWLSRIEHARAVLAATGFTGSKAEEMRQISTLLNGVSVPMLYKYDTFKRLIPELQEFESRRWLSAMTLSAAASLDDAQQKIVADRVEELYKSFQNSTLNANLDFEITREQFNKIVAEVKELNVKRERKQRNYVERAANVIGSCTKYLSSANTPEEKSSALQTISQLRAELDRLELKLRS